MQDQLVKGLRKVAVAPRGSHLEVIAAKGRSGLALAPQTPCRFGSRPTRMRRTPGGGLIKAKLFPYRQKDVGDEVKGTLGTRPNA